MADVAVNCGWLLPVRTVGSELEVMAVIVSEPAEVDAVVVDPNRGEAVPSPVESPEMLVEPQKL